MAATHVYRNRSTGQTVVFDGPHARLDRLDRWAKLTGKDAEEAKEKLSVRSTPTNRSKAGKTQPATTGQGS